MNPQTMNAFVSYSHKDSSTLETLHKHLAQLKRDQIISTWTDQEIPAGGKLDDNISSSLKSSDLFIALLSAEYIASNYCYEREFQTALELQEQGKLIIIPVVVEPCDWLNTPFKDYKALPHDGKPVSTWENKNTAFLDVAQNIRKLVLSKPDVPGDEEEISASNGIVPLSRNYRVKKDFDSIQKIEFTENSFREVKDYLNRFLAEVLQLDNIKGRVVIDTAKEFDCLLVNRNKINTEASAKITIGNESRMGGSRQSREGALIYTITSPNSSQGEKSFELQFDDYHLYWAQTDFFYSSSRTELTTKDIADMVWNELLEKVGIFG